MQEVERRGHMVINLHTHPCAIYEELYNVDGPVSIIAVKEQSCQLRAQGDSVQRFYEVAIVELARIHATQVCCFALRVVKHISMPALYRAQLRNPAPRRHIRIFGNVGLWIAKLTQVCWIKSVGLCSVPPLFQLLPIGMSNRYRDELSRSIFLHASVSFAQQLAIRAIPLLVVIHIIVSELLVLLVLIVHEWISGQVLILCSLTMVEERILSENCSFRFVLLFLLLFFLVYDPLCTPAGFTHIVRWVVVRHEGIILQLESIVHEALRTFFGLHTHQQWIFDNSHLALRSAFALWH
mmetsp:Transcript_36788/g.84725  ORF Transcript_36788/g.84725 Transcript_36788/m.84725 type:complete len:295 (-) Transcript_36788:313-1197(-)